MDERCAGRVHSEKAAGRVGAENMTSKGSVMGRCVQGLRFKKMNLARHRRSDAASIKRSCGRPSMSYTYTNKYIPRVKIGAVSEHTASIPRLDSAKRCTADEIGVP